MNKTVERLIFMLIGALLVSVAYFVGQSDKTADAEAKIFNGDVTIKGHLVVSEGITVARLIPNNKNFIGIHTDENGCALILSHKGETGVLNAQTTLSARKKNAIPVSQITLSTTTGKTVYATSDEKGWLIK